MSFKHTDFVFDKRIFFKSVEENRLLQERILQRDPLPQAESEGIAGSKAHHSPSLPNQQRLAPVTEL